jgi:hypothetical protein
MNEKEFALSVEKLGGRAFVVVGSWGDDDARSILYRGRFESWNLQGSRLGSRLELYRLEVQPFVEVGNAPN